MPDPILHGMAAANISILTPSMVGMAGAAALAFLVRWFEDRKKQPDAQRREDEEAATDLRRTHLDSAQEQFIDRLINDNARYRADARLWEARCRRSDRESRDVRHDLRNERQRHGNFTPVPDPTILEDPLQED